MVTHVLVLRFRVSSHFSLAGSRRPGQCLDPAAAARKRPGGGRLARQRPGGAGSRCGCGRTAVLVEPAPPPDNWWNVAQPDSDT